MDLFNFFLLVTFLVATFLVPYFSIFNIKNKLEILKENDDEKEFDDCAISLLRAFGDRAEWMCVECPNTCFETNKQVKNKHNICTRIQKFRDLEKNK